MSLAQEFRDFVSSFVSWPPTSMGFFGYGQAESGAAVNEITAMQVAAFHSCVRLIADALGSSPLNVYERTTEGDKLADKHPLQPVLSSAPNPELSAIDLRKTAQGHVLITGNAFLEVAYNQGGQPAGLYLRNPYQTWPLRCGPELAAKLQIEPGSLIYKTDDAGRERVIRGQDIIHIKGMGVDGLVGLSPVRLYMREVLGNDIAAQTFSNRFFRSDSRPGGYLKNPMVMKQDVKQQAVATWIAAHTGSNQNSVALLDGGMSWEKVGVNPEEAQFIQTRGMNAKQIGMMFGVPLHFLGDSETSRANMEQRSIEFLIFTMRGWFTAWEQALNMRLFPSVGRNAGRYFCRFNTKDFERATYSDKLRGIQVARYSGLMTADEGRDALGLQPYTDAQFKSEKPTDKLLIPVNMAVISDEAPNGAAPTAGGDSDGEGQGGNDQDGGNGSGKPPSGTTQGGKRALPDPDIEIKRYSAIFTPTFRDALGRLLARKKRDSGDFERCFSPVLFQAASAFNFRGDGEDLILSDEVIDFVREYIAAMMHRAADWKADAGDAIAKSEMRRALVALRDKCVRENDYLLPGDSIEEEEDEEPRRRNITVHVAPPTVNVAAPIVNLSPEIHSHISMPNRPAARTIVQERQEDGSMGYSVVESNKKKLTVSRKEGAITITEDSDVT